MMLQKFHAQLILLLGLRATVLANPVPSTDLELSLAGVIEQLRSEGIEVVTGEPELHAEVHIGDAEGGQLDERHVARQTLSYDQSESLRLHNGYRAAKNLAALTWDDTLAQNAQSWANNMAQTGQFAHSTSAQRPNQGENLAYAWSTRPISNPMLLGTQGWLAEAPYYKGEAIPQGNFSGYGHYTQIMWSSTTRVGIATASNGKGAWYTVARYSPPGNYVGQRPY
jgi:uncharacterized protein YkwD